MITLTNFKDFLTQHKILIIIVGLFFLTLVIVAAVFTRSRQAPFGKLPKPGVDQSLLSPGEKPAVTSKFPQTNLAALPKEGRVFKLKPFPNEKEIAPITSQLAGTANFVKNPEGELVFAGEKSIVFYNKDTGILRFNPKSIKKPEGGEKLTEAQLTDIAKNLLSDLGLYKTADEIVIMGQKYSASFGFEFKSVANFANAEFLDLMISKKLEGAQIIAQTANQSPTFVKISILGEVVILEHYFTETAQSSVYQFKTAEGISRSLSSGGEFFVLQITEEGKDPIEVISPYKLDTVGADKISLSFFREKSNLALLQPVFKIEGVGKTADEKSVDVVLIIPAVSAELISP